MIRSFYRQRIRLEDPYEAPDARGLMCQREGCGQTIRFVYSYQGVGVFCSERCAHLTVERQAQERKAV
jgi:hypothetical protein